MAVQRVREGEKPSVVIASFGFNRPVIYKWLKAAAGRGRGLRALRSTRGTGRPRSLTPAQERQVFRWINGRDPRQYGLDFGLWTRRIVALLIKRKFGIRLGVTAVGALLAKLGLTPQKPLQRAYQRDPQAIERWQREVYPAIAGRARREGADIFVWDESGFRADAVHGKTWGLRGKTPVVHRPGQRQSISAASAINARGAFWFCTYKGALDGERFVGLLRQLIRHRKRGLHLIVDSLPAHRKAVVKDYVQSLGGRLTLHFLPGYAPDLNPDELVWSHVKRTGTAGHPPRRGGPQRGRIDDKSLASRRERPSVRSFFCAPSVAGTADC